MRGSMCPVIGCPGRPASHLRARRGQRLQHIQAKGAADLRGWVVVGGGGGGCVCVCGGGGTREGRQAQQR